MQCIHCKGKMKPSTAPLSIDRKGYHVTWNAVPAWVCTQCGEPYFESRQTDIIQEVLSTLDHQSAELAADIGAP